MTDFFDITARAAHLAGLSLAPTLLSPEPAHASVGPGLLGLLVLALPIVLSFSLRRAAQTLESTVALGAWALTAVVLLVVAHAHTGEGAPLLGGYYTAAPFVFLSLALSGASLAGHFLGPSFKNKRVGAAVIILAIGIFVFRASFAYIASPEQQWDVALKADPSNERAFRSLVGRSSRAAIGTAATACIGARHDACSCLQARADIRLRHRDRAGAVSDAKQARTAGCALDARLGDMGTLRETLALGLAETGDLDGSDELTREAPDAAAPRIAVAQGLVAQARGDLSAAETLALPAAKSGDRDASLLLASIYLARGDVGRAQPLLDLLVKADPDDVDAVYDLALANDLRGEFNPAREGYLKALKLDPTYRAARYNLTVLTMRQGIVQEARHHALEFAAQFPDDDRAAGLLKLTGATLPRN